jgi:orotidine-5'-phosphate decarboxylase
MTATSPVFCAIDRPDLEGGLALGQALIGAVSGLKVGLEFVTANGPDGVRKIVELGLPVFLDVKLHDIPNTVAGAVRAAGRLGVRFITIHTAGGRAMLAAAAEAAAAAPEPPLLLGVTVLTSLDDGDLQAIGVQDRVAAQVQRLAGLARDAGLAGVISAPQEIRPLRSAFGRDLTLMVPGIRPAGSAAGDQTRVMTPADAVAAGADHVVIGRPISQAADPRAAALSIQAELDNAAPPERAAG